MNAPNYHLNLFRHYAENTTNEVLENNLTRALALCLLHDPVYLHGFLEEIMGLEALRAQLHLQEPESRIDINLQQSVTSLQPCGMLYAVALTAGKLDVTSYETEGVWSTASPITDLTLRLNDVQILIEVKRDNTNCLGQLKGQVNVYQQAMASSAHQTQPTLKVKCLHWAQVVRLATDRQNFRQLTGSPNPFTADFADWVRYHFPSWDEPLFFTAIPFLTKDKAVNESALYRRLHYIEQQQFTGKLRGFSDRTSIIIDKLWANEVIIRPDWDADQQRAYISLQIWPGNTKGQGWYVYDRDLSWINQHNLEVDGHQYPLHVEQYLKFAHFNRFVCELELVDSLEPYAQNFRSMDAFNTFAGKWWRSDWPELHRLLNRDTGGLWQDGSCEWQEEFESSNRNYCTVSLGFYVKMRLPYEELQALDTSPEGLRAVGVRFESAIQALIRLVEGR